MRSFCIFVSVFIVMLVISPVYGELSGSVGIPFPMEKFKEGYDGVSSFDVRFGLTSQEGSEFDETRLFYGFFLRGIQDNFRLSDAAALERGVTGIRDAKMLSAYLGGHGGVQYRPNKYFSFGPTLYHGFGVSWFSVPESMFNQLGGSTGMELRDENDSPQFSYSWGMGVSATGFNCLSLRTGYEFVTVESDFTHSYIIPHWILNGMIHSTIVELPPAIAMALLPENARNSIITPLTCLAYMLGSQVLLYYSDYDHHNWPFDDPTPVHYGRATVTLAFEF